METIGSQIVVGRTGTLYNGFDLIQNVSNKNKIRGQSVALQRSTDRGASRSGASVVSPVQVTSVTTPDGAEVRTGDIVPDIAIDTADKLYAVWQDARFKAGGTSGIALSRSVDGGRTWSAPVQVDDAGTAQAFNPSVDVADDGRLAVTWYDFRNDTSAPSALTDTWVRHSGDGGLTWTPSQRVTTSSFDLRNAPEAGGYFLGDYTGLGHAGSEFRIDVAVTGSTAHSSDIHAATAG